MFTLADINKVKESGKEASNKMFASIAAVRDVTEETAELLNKVVGTPEVKPKDAVSKNTVANQSKLDALADALEKLVVSDEVEEKPQLTTKVKGGKKKSPAESSTFFSKIAAKLDEDGFGGSRTEFFETYKKDILEYFGGVKPKKEEEDVVWSNKIIKSVVTKHKKKKKEAVK